MDRRFIILYPPLLVYYRYRYRLLYLSFVHPFKLVKLLSISDYHSLSLSLSFCHLFTVVSSIVAISLVVSLALPLSRVLALNVNARVNVDYRKSLLILL